MGWGFSVEAGKADPSKGYRQVNLVGDERGAARNIDSNLINPWGVVVQPFSQIRVSDNGSGTSTVYRPNGKKLSPVVNIPGSGGIGKGAPTGFVYNDTQDFVISGDSKSAPAKFLFATEEGIVLGWNADVDSTNAIVAIDNSATNPSPGAVYKGIAIGQSSGENFIFVTNFRAGVVEIYDANFSFVKSFSDNGIPAGFAPFGISNINGDLYVTYAKQDPDKHDDVSGQGNGYVDIFDTGGNLVKRFASKGELNSPWGLALAPERFGTFSKAILVGNAGDGTINAFEAATGKFLGQMQDLKQNTIVIDGLHGFDFGKISVDENAAGVDPRPVLFFAAGTDQGSHGLFGYLRPYSPGNDHLYVDFGSQGLYSYDGSDWTKINNSSPDKMAASGSDLYASYGKWGLWKWDGTSWTQINTNSPGGGVVGVGADLYANYGKWGLWKWDGTSWTQVDRNTPGQMAAGGTKLYANHGTLGVWRWDGTSWTQIDTNSPDLMAASDTTFYANYGAWGVWQWDGTTWTQINSGKATSLTASGEDLYASFGEWGLWKWDGTQWTQVDANLPDNMSISGGRVYSNYGGWGVWEYDGVSWTQLNKGKAKTMASPN